jgi:hypothetical protein
MKFERKLNETQLKKNASSSEVSGGGEEKNQPGSFLHAGRDAAKFPLALAKRRHVVTGRRAAFRAAVGPVHRRQASLLQLLVIPIRKKINVHNNIAQA